MIIIPIAFMVFIFLTRYLNSIVAENLNFKVRVELFQEIIHKSISWFDSKERAPGTISNILSQDVQ